MTRRGVILYGPPASGKDTITAELARLDDRFVLLTKLKAGTGRSAGYRYVSAAELDALRAEGRLVIETERYGNRYAVDRHDIDALIDAGRIPIVHMGDIPGVTALSSAVPLTWTRVRLCVPREVTAARSTHRGDTDTASRLAAWDEAEADRRTNGEAVTFDLTIRTHETDPAEAAKRISRATLG
ncbi:guanylate kinase [Actinomadura logoneensis]|uniref:Guanylate kinase n=1 Tax=Actinomadura logoneensis TaxID=2293572 RepID=A0A372JS34_9ACTN|nr:guanylate kinase [Actinomadura logoneensis]RFU42760.1 guanylate kinase [Actinomadura logoneensis]